MEMIVYTSIAYMYVRGRRERETREDGGNGMAGEVREDYRCEKRKMKIERERALTIIPSER